MKKKKTLKKRIDRQVIKADEGLADDQVAMKAMRARKNSYKTQFSSQKKSLYTKKMISELQELYKKLVRAYLSHAQKEAESMVDVLCRSFAEMYIEPGDIVDLHIKAVKAEADDINPLTAQQKVSQARMVLLMVMTKYAGLLREQIVE